MTDRELMQQALEAMRFALHVGFDESSESQIKKGDKAVRQHEAAITALRERLAQPEMQPCAGCKVIMDSLQKQADLATDALDRRWALEMIAAVAARSSK